MKKIVYFAIFFFIHTPCAEQKKNNLKFINGWDQPITWTIKRKTSETTSPKTFTSGEGQIQERRSSALFSASDDHEIIIKLSEGESCTFDIKAEKLNVATSMTFSISQIGRPSLVITTHDKEMYQHDAAVVALRHTSVRALSPKASPSAAVARKKFSFSDGERKVSLPPIHTRVPSPTRVGPASPSKISRGEHSPLLPSSPVKKRSSLITFLSGLHKSPTKKLAGHNSEPTTAPSYQAIVPKDD